MKKQNIIIILAVIAVAIVAGVTAIPGEKAEAPIVPSTTAPNILTLSIGQTGKFEDLTVRFDAVTGDSRCPTDVQCIQAGWVDTNVTLSSGTREETKALKSNEGPVTFGDYKISIETVAPPKKSQTVISPGEYMVTFRVTR